MGSCLAKNTKTTEKRLPERKVLLGKFQVQHLEVRNVRDLIIFPFDRRLIGYMKVDPGIPFDFTELHQMSFSEIGFEIQIYKDEVKYFTVADGKTRNVKSFTNF